MLQEAQQLFSVPARAFQRSQSWEVNLVLQIVKPAPPPSRTCCLPSTHTHLSVSSWALPPRRKPVSSGSRSSAPQPPLRPSHLSVSSWALPPRRKPVSSGSRSSAPQPVAYCRACRACRR